MAGKPYLGPGYRAPVMTTDNSEVHNTPMTDSMNSVLVRVILYTVNPQSNLYPVERWPFLLPFPEAPYRSYCVPAFQHLIRLLESPSPSHSQGHNRKRLCIWMHLFRRFPDRYLSVLRYSYVYSLWDGDLAIPSIDLPTINSTLPH